MANDYAILKAADRPEYLFSVGERSRLGCTGRRPADRTVCSARAPNTARGARALPTLNRYRPEVRSEKLAAQKN